MANNLVLFELLIINFYLWSVFLDYQLLPRVSLIDSSLILRVDKA